jgi:hypothetical protein
MLRFDKFLFAFELQHFLTLDVRFCKVLDYFFHLRSFIINLILSVIITI